MRAMHTLDTRQGEPGWRSWPMLGRCAREQKARLTASVVYAELRSVRGGVMSKVRCRDCLHEPPARYCEIGDVIVRDRNRIRFCPSFRSSETGDFNADGMRLIANAEQVFGAAVLDGTLAQILIAMALDVPSMFATRYRLYGVMNGIVCAIDSNQPTDWSRHMVAAAPMFGIGAHDSFTWS